MLIPGKTRKGWSFSVATILKIKFFLNDVYIKFKPVITYFIRLIHTTQATLGI